MSESYARPRFGAPREPKTRVDPGSQLVRVIDFVTVSHIRSIAFLLLCGALLFLPVAALGPLAEHLGPIPFGG